MDIVIVQLIDQRVYQLLEDMEELNLIRLIRKSAKISALRGQIQTPMSNDEIDEQINAIRKEWERDVLN